MPGADVGHRRVVVDRLGPDRLDQGDLVDDLGRPGQELADPHARLAVLGELVLRRCDREPGLAAGHGGQPLALADRIGKVLVEPLVHLGLVVQEVHLRGTSVHEQVDGPLGLGGEMRQAWQSPGREACWLGLHLVDDSPGLAGLRQQAGEGDGSQAHAGGAAEEVPARHHFDLFANRIHGSALRELALGHHLVEVQDHVADHRPRGQLAGVELRVGPGSRRC